MNQQDNLHCGTMTGELGCVFARGRKRYKCVECQRIKAAAKVRAFRAAHPAEAKRLDAEKGRKYRAAHPERIKSRKRVYSLEARRLNPSKFKKLTKAWLKLHPEVKKKADAKYRSKNRRVLAEKERARVERKKALDPSGFAAHRTSVRRKSAAKYASRKSEKSRAAYAAKIADNRAEFRAAKNVAQRAYRARKKAERLAAEAAYVADSEAKMDELLAKQAAK